MWLYINMRDGVCIYIYIYIYSTCAQMVVCGHIFRLCTNGCMPRTCQTAVLATWTKLSHGRWHPSELPFLAFGHHECPIFQRLFRLCLFLAECLRASFPIFLQECLFNRMIHVFQQPFDPTVSLVATAAVLFLPLEVVAFCSLRCLFCGEG